MGEGSVTMRRGGPHPCVPGVPFMILTLHSGMKGETEEGTHQQRWTEGGRDGGGGREQRNVPPRRAAAAGCVCMCVCRPLPSCGCVLPRAYSGSCLLCTLARSGDKALFHSPSTRPYQSPHRSPDCNSLPNLNLHADEQISPPSSPSHPEDPPSHAMAKMSASP